MNNFSEIDSPVKFSKEFNVPLSTIRYWIKKSYIYIKKKDGNITFVNENQVRNLIVDKVLGKYYPKNESYLPKEIKDLSEWSRALNYFSWLFKICYSSKENIKKGKFRSDEIFQNFVLDDITIIKKLKPVIKGNGIKKKKIRNALVKGWYNELSFLYPFKKSTLGLGFNDISINKEISNIRFAFPSWKIINFYYALYFFIQSNTLCKTDKFRSQEHNATIRTFNSSLFNLVTTKLYKYPLNLYYENNSNHTFNDLEKIPHSKFEYSKHPQAPNLTPKEIENFILKTYKKKSKKIKDGTKYNFLNLMSDFRTWANYIDIDNLLSFWGSGFRSFLDQDLSFILFIFGGISEIFYIVIFGERLYLEAVQSFYKDFILKNELLQESFQISPVFQRSEIYLKKGLISKGISLNLKEDINKIT